MRSRSKLYVKYNNEITDVFLLDVSAENMPGQMVGWMDGWIDGNMNE